jgi:adenosylcobinamide-GDP ribazoletransferase
MRLITDPLLALRFFTRLPIPASEGEGAPELNRVAWAVPLVGLVVGGAGALASMLASNMATGMVCAVIGVAVTIILTGALHEDGLSDTCDGFFGGHSAEKRLAIMRDSRIGAFGAIALVVMLLLKVALLTQSSRGGANVMAAHLLAVAIASRALMLLPLALLPHARSDGLAAGVGRITMPAFLAAVCVAALLSLVELQNTGLLRLGFAWVVGLLVALGVSRLARNKIGGATGDVAGATQQVSEIAMLFVLAGQ